MKKWYFGTNNDYLVDLVLKGEKTATTSIYDGVEAEIGKEEILIYDNEKEACVTRTLKVTITEFKNITEDMTLLEGEGDFESWYTKHLEYFKSIDKTFTEETKVQFEEFEVVRNLVEERKAIADKIIELHQNIFGEVKNVEEVNAGFNNTVFNVDGKFIIKICTDEAEESKFKVEVDFYNANTNNPDIPHLFKYDDSKADIPYMYEILEKVPGDSVYYHWYKMDEAERENIIKRIVEIVESIHRKEYDGYDWATKVKDEVLDCFNECIDLFDFDEQDTIKYSLKLYNTILSDNRFAYIHNDLHFDNILIDSTNDIKIIDFNDAIIAPFDYDYRLLYMCIEQPWKWANSEMDPYQKPDDYKKIFEYIKEYDEELKKVNYLEHRMIIYSVLYDIRHLKRFKTKELKSRVVANSQLLIDKFVEKEQD